MRTDRSPANGVLDDPRLEVWTREAVARRLAAGEPRPQAELHGYADAIAALQIVRRVATGDDAGA